MIVMGMVMVMDYLIIYIYIYNINNDGFKLIFCIFAFLHFEMHFKKSKKIEA